MARMRRMAIFLALCMLLTASTAEQQTESRAAELELGPEVERVVLVEYLGGTDAEVSRHERQNGLWRELDSTYGYVGQTGMGKKRAGDNKTPLGIFNLTTPFGILDDPDAAQPYLKVTRYHYWCSTSGSPYYNQLVDERETGRSGSGPDEILIEYEGYYDYAMFIDYNAEGKKGKGACIFLHCIGDRDWTHGCVAVPREYMRNLLRWADEGTKIAILVEPLQSAQEAPDVMKDFVVISNGDVNIRTGPGIEYPVAGVLAKGERLEYLGQEKIDTIDSRWRCVRYGGQECWVSARYSRFSQ